MASPRNTLGPYPLRGLVSDPRNYGDARVAENVQWHGDWCETRKGTAPVLSTLGYVPTEITFVEEFRPRSNPPILVVVGTDSTSSHRVQTYVDGSTTATTDFTIGNVAGRPSAVVYQNNLVLFLPIDSTNPYTMWVIDPDGVAAVLDPIDVAPVGGDAGTYRGTGDYVRGIFGCNHLDRLFVVRDEDPHVVWYSNFEDLYGWPLNNFFQPFGDSTEPLTGLASFNGGLLAFSRYSIALINFAGQGLEEIKILKHNTGAVLHQAITAAGNTLAFLSDDGLLFMDIVGNVTEGPGEAINEILNEYQTGFGEASLHHYAYRRQLWLLVPQAKYIMVLDMRIGNWSTIQAPNWKQSSATIYTTGRNPGALGQQRQTNGQDVPLLGSTADTNNAAGTAAGVVRFEEDDYLDWVGGNGSSSEYQAVESAWLSHAVPFEGSDLHRLYLGTRIIFADRGDHEARVFWLTQGQAASTNLYNASQYEDVTLQSPEDIARCDEAIVGSDYTPMLVGELEFEDRVAFSGVLRGRWLQLGVTVNTEKWLSTTAVPWQAKRFRLITRAKVSRRTR